MKLFRIFAVISALGAHLLIHAQEPTPVVDEAASAAQAAASTETVAANLKARAERIDTMSTGTHVLATYRGGEFTNEDLSATIALRRPRNLTGLTPADIMGLPKDKLAEVVKDLVYERLVYNEAKAAGITEETTGIKERIQRYRRDVLNRLYFDRLVTPRIAQLKEKAQREYYEQNKNTIYTRPGVTTVREIFLSGYKPYESKTGETLKEVVVRESGDEAAMKRVLRNDGAHYPRTPVFPDQVPFEEITSGARLLVPISKDERTSKSALAARLRAQAIEGKDFAQLAQAHSEAPSESRSRPFSLEDDMFPSARAALDSTESSVTKVIESPHGWHIFKIADKQGTQSLSFEEVKHRIEITPETEQALVEQVRRELFDELSKKYQLKINTEALKRPDDRGANPLTADTPIVSSPDFTYTLQQFQRDMVPTMKSWTGHTFEQRLDLAKSNPTVTQYLVSKAASEAGLDKTPQYETEMRSKIVIEVTSEYFQNHKPRFIPPTDEDLRAYYNKNIDRYTSAPTVTFREIIKRVNPMLPPDKREAAIKEAQEQLLRIRNAIKSPQDFEQYARRESQALSTRSRGGLVGPVPEAQRGEAFREQLAKLQPGDMSEPFVYGSEVALIRLENRTGATPQPFESALPRVRTDYFRTEPQKQVLAERDRVLEQNDFQLKI